MSDEQTIYISPEDDLTNVRERLERVATRQLTLIIPTQTRLRSHVAWKVLHGDARRLGKDVLIISSDPQIRSVAQAAKFRVANSLESSSNSKSAPTSRPSRSGPGVRGKGPIAQSRTSQARTPPTRRSVDLRGTASSRAQPEGPARRSGQLRPSPQWEEPLSEHPEQWQEPESEKPGPEEAETGGLGKQGSSTFETFETPDKRYGRNYDFRIDTSPPILPLSPQQIEEPNLLLEDFNRAQDIRQAALQGVDEEGRPPVFPKEKRRFEGAAQSYQPAPLPHEADDPFSYMEDLQPPPKGEQRGAVSIEGFDTTEQAIRGDISDYPTNVIDGEVEYEGDLGNFAPPADKPPVTRFRNEEAPDKQREADDLPARIHGMRPRSSRSGWVPELDAADALPPVDDRPTLISQRPPQPVVMPPQGQPRPSPAPASAGGSRAEQPPVGRNRAPQPIPAQAARNRPPALASAARRQGQARAGAMPAPRGRGRGGIGIAIAILLLLLAGGLAYFGPSADVTITLPATNYSHAVVLTANTISQQSDTLHTIPAEIHTKADFTVSGKDFKASGSQAVGQSPATGKVVFTNTGASPVIIPTGTIVTTSGNNAINFATTAEGVAPANGDSPLIPVQAQQSGSNSNVGAGVIVNIPETSLAAIAQNNNVDVNSLKLNVTNPDKTSGGGTANIPVVMHTDIQAAQDALHKQVQSLVDAWKPQLPAGDVAGKPYITQETLLNAPVEGAKIDTPTFSATLTADASVLVVSSAAIQDGARAQLNDFLNKDSKYRSGYTVVTGAGYPVNVVQLQPLASADGKSLTLNFTATGKIVPRVTSQQVQGLIIGKPAGEAHDLLLRQIPQAQQVDIKVYPGFVTWVTFWAGHINVTIVPGTPAKTGP